MKDFAPEGHKYLVPKFKGKGRGGRGKYKFKGGGNPMVKPILNWRKVPPAHQPYSRRAILLPKKIFFCA